MIKIIHTADVHLDSPLRTLALRDPDLHEKVQGATRSAFSRIVDQAIGVQAHALLIAGDLFDGTARSAKTAAFLLSELNRLSSAGIPAFYIKGNHDAENPLTGETTLPDNVHLFDGQGSKVQLEGTDVWIHGVSFTGKIAEESLLSKFSSPVENSINIGMLHTSLAGSAGHDVYAPCSVKELVDTGFDYWALGHIHKRQVHSEAPWVVMPGIPQGRDIGEPGPQSATLITIDEGTITTSKFPTSSIEFIRLALDVSQLQAANDLQELAQTELKALAASLTSDDAIVRVQLEGQSALRWQWLRDQEQWKESLNLLCRETGKLWIEKLIFDVVDVPTVGADKSAMGELSALMATIRDGDAFHKEAVELIEEILAPLPASERAKLLPDENAITELANSLSEQGQEHLLAVMKGVSDMGPST